MAADATKVRNVGIFGHGGAGKTTLIEHLLHSVGKTTRIGTIADGNTVGDYLEEEIAHEHSISMKLMHLDWNEVRVHLVDVPGYADFLGEVAATMPVLDAAIVVIDAASGPRVGTDHAMSYAKKHNVPVAIFVNKLDHENILLDEVIDQIQKTYGQECAPFVVPNGTGGALSSVVNIVTGSNDDMADQIEEMKTALTEVVAESDDALVERYLENGELTAEEFDAGLRAAIKNGALKPIVCGSATKDLGTGELLDLITGYFPGPLERHIVVSNGIDEEIEIKADADGPFFAQVFRSVVDPFVGHLTLFRVLSGTLKADSDFYNVSSQSKERTGKLYLLCGKEQTQVDEVGPGDLAAMAKLKHTHFGDTIAAAGTKHTLPKISLPDSMVKLAISGKSQADEDKIGEALNRIAEEDPTFTHYRDSDTNEHVVRGMGDLQLEILLDRMKRKYHVEAETQIPKVAFKETVKGTADVQGKHRKQSGGHGQYGDVRLKISPNTRGAGYEFIDKIVGGVVPRQYIPAVDKGAHEALRRGVIAGFPVVDIKVELHFGSYHDVDSSEMAFRTAASVAIRKGVKEAKPCILEPTVELEVTVPSEFMGDINGDISGRRGRILAMESAGPGRERIKAQVPEAEVLRYSTDLRSLTHGQGSFTMKFDHYDEVPDHIAKSLIEAFVKSKESGGD